MTACGAGRIRLRRLTLALKCGLIFTAACHKDSLDLIDGALIFASPDQPAALTQPDAGRVQIAFGQVTIGATKTLTLSFSAVARSVTLNSLAMIHPDPEFSLPFPIGSVVGSAPSQITVGFTPVSIGQKSAVFELMDAAPASESVFFELTGEGIANGIVVTPDPVDFGAVELNQSQLISLSITNHGRLPANLVVSPPQGSDATLFNLGAPATTTLALDATTTLTAVFAPLATGDAGASFTVEGWPDIPPVTVPLVGIGVQSWLQVVSPLDFGFVQLPDTFVKPAVVRNVGSFTTLHLVTPAPLVTQPAGQSVFSLGSPPVSLPVTLGPGQSAAIPVSFAPASLGELTGTLFVTSDDPASQYPAIQLEGYGGGPEIFCLPQVSFGPVPEGYWLTQPVVCLNRGTSIPSLPDLKLQIAQSGLSTDAADFSASLRLGDGGAAGAGDGVSLAPGESVTIDVRFQPEDAGVYQARLSVASNDIDDADAGTFLTGQGIVPGACSLQAIPRQLSFGDVPPGSVAAQELELRNAGPDLCIVTSVAFDSTSAAGFSLPEGDIGYQLLSYPGDPDNPTNIPMSLQVPVQFASGGAVDAATGTIDITAANSSPAESRVSATAYSAGGCLKITPVSFDFGTVFVSSTDGGTYGGMCSPDLTTFVGTNGCGAPVLISRLAVTPDIDGVAQFALVATGFPVTVNPGDQVNFQVGLVPTSIGPKVGSLVVTSSDSPSAPHVLPLAGNPELEPRVDTFIVPAAPKELDLLWVLDNDDDWDQVQNVASLLPQLIAGMNEAQIDYQIVVTSTDTCTQAINSDQGLFEPCDHCLSSGSANALIVNPATADPALSVSNLFANFDLAPIYGACNNFNGDEHFFDSIADALSADNLSGHNAGFVRPGADLAIVVVNGDGEDNGGVGTAGGLGFPERYPTTVQQVTSLLEGLKPDAGMASVSYINDSAGPLENSELIGQLVEATNGSWIDTSQATAVWANAVLDLFAFAGGSGAFRLSTPGIDIQVYVSGVLTTDWSYDPYQQEIIFDPTGLPAPGSTVTVKYLLACQ